MTTTSKELLDKYERGVKHDFGFGDICHVITVDDPREGYDMWHLLILGVEFKLIWAPYIVNEVLVNHTSFISTLDWEANIPNWARLSQSYFGLLSTQAACRLVLDIEATYSRAYRKGRKDLKESFAKLMNLESREER